MIVGVASYVATPHVAPYVYVCVGGWEGEGGGQHGAPFGSKATETFKNMVVHFVVCVCVFVCV